MINKKIIITAIALFYLFGLGQVAAHEMENLLSLHSQLVVQTDAQAIGNAKSSLKAPVTQKPVLAGPLCDDACSTEYQTCLKKGLDFGTFMSAPKSVVKRICADEARMCHLECRMGYHVSAEKDAQ